MAAAGAPSAAVGDFVVLFDSRALLPVERRATQEFVALLNESVGATLAVQDLSSSSELDPDANYLAVGHTAATRLGVNASKHLAGLGAEGIVLSAALVSPHVIVCGGVSESPSAGTAEMHGNPALSSNTQRAVDGCQQSGLVVAERGTMYALNTFLHLLGFRWYAHDCIKKPSHHASTPLSSLLVTKQSDWPVDIRFVPAFESRDLGYHCAFLSPDWARHNFINGACCGPRVAAQEKAYDRFTVPWADDQVYGGHLRFSRWPGFEHTLPTMIPAATYFATHPEWWGLDAKTGQRSKDLQMCFSNSELAKQVADKVALAIDLDAAYGPQGLDARSPLPNAVAVVQGDGNGFCECGPCAAIYKEEGGRISGAVVRFVNAIAKEVAASRPEYAGVRIDTLAYEETLLPPTKTAPAANVTIRVCPIDADFHVPFTDERNANPAQAFKEWSALCAQTGAQLWVYTYNTDFSHYLLPYPDVTAVCENVSFFHSLGLKGVFEEGPYMSPGGNFAELKAWVLAQLLWDPTAAIATGEPPQRGLAQQLVTEFIEAYYGSEGAIKVQAFLEALLKSAADADTRMGLNPGPKATFLSPDFLLDAEVTLDAAVSQSESGSCFWQRCRLLRLGVWYVMLLRFTELRSYALQHREPGQWQWGEKASGSLFEAFAQVYACANVTHLNEDGRDIFWLRREIIAAETAAAAVAAPCIDSVSRKHRPVDSVFVPVKVFLPGGSIRRLAIPIVRLRGQCCGDVSEWHIDCDSHEAEQLATSVLESVSTCHSVGAAHLTPTVLLPTAMWSRLTQFKKFCVGSSAELNPPHTKAAHTVRVRIIWS